MLADLLLLLSGLTGIPTDSPCSRAGLQHPRAGAQRVGRVAAARVLPGPVSHLPVAAQERLHRPRTHWTPHFLLRLRQEAEEEEQDVSGVQDAHPVGGLHLLQLRWSVHACGTTASDLTGSPSLWQQNGTISLSHCFQKSSGAADVWRSQDFLKARKYLLLCKDAVNIRLT